MEKAQENILALIEHKLKGPLTTINLYSEGLLTGTAGPLTDAQKEHVEEIHSASGRAVSMLNALMRNTRNENTK